MKITMHKRVMDITRMKNRKKIVTVTAYDYTMATLCDEGGADILLVGDSAGMVMLGYKSTIPVSMSEMCVFTGAVSRARNDALVVADLPFLSYNISKQKAIRNSGRLIQCGADAIKLEGGMSQVETIRSIVNAGIPVMGHIGIQPQSAEILDGYGIRGEDQEEAESLQNDAYAMQDAGVFSIVLEKVAAPTARKITNAISVPTIGIGSGVGCDGQVLVIQDMLGMHKNNLRFVKQYANLAEDIRGAINTYKEDVESERFPSKEHSFGDEL